MTSPCCGAVRMGIGAIVRVVGRNIVTNIEKLMLPYSQHVSLSGARKTASTTETTKKCITETAAPGLETEQRLVLQRTMVNFKVALCTDEMKTLAQLQRNAATMRALDILKG
jgi:hypothetical protein